MSSRGLRTRERILAAAEQDLIAHDGIDIVRVASAAGISVGGLYHHFAAKDDLLAAVVTAFHARHNEQVIYAEIPGPWRERERERIRRSVRFHYADPLAPLLVTRAVTDAQIARIDAQELARAARASAANLAAAQRNGELPATLDCDLAGAMLMGGSRQVIARALTLKRRPAASRLADELWAMCAAIVDA
ncbi:TetR/AcrR family transcriptional regulator [Patulibacter medicamentivorans]|uniref:TetR/AcrR family transcriptional regulator n=1 Tax=Patulibacter medicamentivorans TaxID=1097667 RepID=UPI00058D5FE7|nr:TetR/AcrR family transcriptional regulator [Patulibacter medicamentivorans]